MSGTLGHDSKAGLLASVPSEEASHRAGASSRMQGDEPPDSPAVPFLGTPVGSHGITVWQLVGMTYFAVSGGPFGFEDAIGAGGALLSSVGVAFLCIVWSLPLSMMTMELSNLIPGAGGHVLWVKAGLGLWWARQHSLCVFLNSVFDNAMYPVLCIDYLQELWPGLELNAFGYWVMCAVIVGLALCFNVLGIDLVGNASVIFTVMTMLPFVVMVVLGLPEVDLGRIAEVPKGGVEWGRFVSLLLWNTCGYDSVGSISQEVGNPGKAFPVALKITVALTSVNYLLPSIVGVGAVKHIPLHRWTDGTFGYVASEIGSRYSSWGGTFLGSWLSAAACASSFGLLTALICTSSRLVVGMSASGVLPEFYGRASTRFETPVVAILLNSLTCLVAIVLGIAFSSFVGQPMSSLFATLTEANMFFYNVSTLLKFAALYRLRFSVDPHGNRPYKIWVSSRAGMLAFIAAPVACCVVGIALTNRWPLIFGSVVVIAHLGVGALGTFLGWYPKDQGLPGLISDDDDDVSSHGRAPLGTKSLLPTFTAVDPQDGPTSSGRSSFEDQRSDAGSEGGVLPLTRSSLELVDCARL